MNITDKTKELYEKNGIDKEIFETGEKILSTLNERFSEIDRISEYGQLKVVSAMQKCRVSEACLLGTTGYGYNDLGRDTLEKVYCEIFHTEDALVRPQITCGTHALTVALFGNLRPGDELLSPVGRPYDTLSDVIGLGNARGSLKEYNVSYREVALNEDESFDYEGIKNAINDKTKLVTIQRSKGYSDRHSFTVKEIGELISFIKGIRSDLNIMVDNCYGEFVDIIEPSDVGADLIVGSLIKNPGGGLAPLGGYLAGKKEMIENAASRLISPGLLKEVGASLNVLPSFYQGLFMAPVVTANALKTAIFASYMLGHYGFKTNPGPTDKRADIIEAVTFNDPEKVKAFCRGIQFASPVDGFVSPEPWDMPGYDSQVIMAAGAFISGSSIELSADGPMREPYNVYFQGGLTFPHGKYGILKALSELKKEGLLDKNP